MNSRSKLTLVLLALLVAPATAHARGFELTPFWGWLVSSEVDGSDPGYEFDNDTNFGITLGIPVLGPDQVEIFYANYETALRSDEPGEPRAAEVDFTYLHVGGHWERGRGPGKMFAVASAGIVEIDPKGSFYRSETLPSAGLGGGGKHYFTDHVGVRGEGRILANWIDGSHEIFCNPQAGCLGRVSGSVLWQFQASLGLVLRFGD